MTFIDGFALAVPTAKKDAFVDHAHKFWRIARDYGCLRQVEAWGEEVPDGANTSFPLAVKAEPGETVVFSFLEWPSKAVRDDGMARMMKDERMKEAAISEMPFDGKRMIMGGFQPVVDERFEDDLEKPA